MSNGQSTTPRYRNLQIGEKFGRLTVIGPPEARIVGATVKNRKFWYLCRCECGIEKKVESCGLISGNTRSCGCLKRDRTVATFTTHGQSRSPLYGVWNAIISRCENPNSESYHRYGGRGITMWPEWRESYPVFHEWAMANGYRRGLTIERKNNDKPYSPDNCEFANRTVQARNRRSSVMLTAFGETKTLAEWALDSRANASYGLIHWRIKRGVDHLTAITFPPDPGRKIPSKN